MYCGTGMQARSASCRGPYGSTGMQGGLRRGACGTVYLGRVCYGRVWCIGEGMQEGHALICIVLLRAVWGLVVSSFIFNDKFYYPPVGNFKIQFPGFGTLIL
jgi:hypothetical protein